ncbi:SUMF1/EgtB/PvdO family nonheme iron enzyme [bacterium]|nr:SUMF1/EgtB/PvdO family nonheme iron enzyme [bacterium]
MSGDFIVNSTGIGDQFNPVVGMLPGGRMVAVWHANYSNLEVEGIYARIFDADDEPETGEITVHSALDGAQSKPTLAVAPDGRFVVAWTSTQDGTAGSIYAQRFNSSGVPQGSEFRVNNASFSGEQSYADVAIASNGNFVVVWQSDGQDGSGWGVFGQRFHSSGAAIGDIFQVNTTVLGDQNNPAVAIASDGSFTVVWEGNDENKRGVFAQRFAADGTPQLSQFRVNTVYANDQRDPAVAYDGDGGAIVVWASRDDESDSVVMGQRFNSADTPVGGEFPISDTDSDSFYPQLAVSADGGFVAVWEGEQLDGSSDGIGARIFNDIGLPVGGVVTMNTTVDGPQRRPSLALGDGGDWMVVWQSNDSLTTGYDIRGRLVRVNPEWLPVDGGTFQMGCVNDGVNPCDADALPQHTVQLSAFEMTETEVTQAQFIGAMGFNPSLNDGCLACPVESVTWQEASDYCAAVGGDLPTEAEWEYAARAGNASVYGCGNSPTCLSDYAWTWENAADIHRVGQKSPNDLGLRDMLGNVAEWVADWYDVNYYATSPTADPTGPVTGAERVIRGSSFLDLQADARIHRRMLLSEMDGDDDAAAIADDDTTDDDTTDDDTADDDTADDDTADDDTSDDDTTDDDDDDDTAPPIEFAETVGFRCVRAPMIDDDDDDDDTGDDDTAADDDDDASSGDDDILPPTGDDDDDGFRTPEDDSDDSGCGI